MVGNDIVDIAQAKQDSNWQRPRFLDKLFTVKEKQKILASVNPFIMVWRLWSMKEAAYKLYVQLNPNRFYNPKKFECSFKDKHCVVEYSNFKCFVKTKTTKDYIISEASLRSLKLNSEVIKFDLECIKSQSELLKKALINAVLKQHPSVNQKLEFKKDAYGVPIIEFNKTKIHVSLTHHGKYGAFAIA